MQKPYPPFMIGGSGEKLTLRVVAKHADVCNFVAGPVEEYQRKASILAEHCKAVNRDPATIIHSTQVRIEYDNLAAALQRTQEFLDAEASHFVYTPSSPYPDNIVYRIADEVVGKVR